MSNLVNVNREGHILEFYEYYKDIVKNDKSVGEFYTFLSKIDYTTLDYSISYNLVILCTYAKLSNGLYNFVASLDIIETHSKIIYNKIMQMYSVIDDSIYIDIIKQCSPSTPFEHIIYNLNLHEDELKQNDQKLVEDAINKFRMGCNDYNDNFIFSILIDDICDTFMVKEYNNNEIKVLLQTAKCINELKYEKALENLYKLNNSCINKNYIDVKIDMCKLCSVNDYSIGENFQVYISKLEKLFSSNQKYMNEYLIWKTIQELAFTYIRMIQNKNFKLYESDVDVYITKWIGRLQLTYKTGFIYTNYYGSKLHQATIEKNNDNILLYSKKLLPIFEDRINKSSGRTSLISIIDLFKIYKVLICYEKEKYVIKLLQIYDKYEKVIMQNIRNPLLISVLNTIFIAFIHTHQINKLRQMYLICDEIDFSNINKFLPNEYKVYVENKNKINRTDNLIKYLDFRLDYGKITDNNDICPICCDEIQKKYVYSKMHKLL